MQVSEFISKLEFAADNCKTLYVSGCFGAPLNATNRRRYTQNNAYNRQASRQQMISTASDDTFGFDCVNLIKGIIWGWVGDKKHVYGGAVYNAKGLGDISEDQMIQRCRDASSGNWTSIEPGEVVWIPGHIGVYVGDGTVIECSPKWKNGVQRTALGNLGSRPRLNTRTWSKHGHLPYIEYKRKEDDEMTYEQFSEYMDRYRADQSKLPFPDWGEKDWDVLKEHGIVANKEWPLALATRQDIVSMMARLYTLLVQ